MSNYAVVSISDNVVVNIVVWDGITEWGPGEGYITVELSDEKWCDIGAIYDKDNGTFAYPEGYQPPIAERNE